MKKTLYVFVWACSVLLALPAAAQVPGYVPTDGLVGWWPFNGNANDESGNGNDGVVNGATLTEDRFGITDKSYSFNGETDFIEINNAILNQINNLNAASVSYWFNTIENEQGAIWGHHSNSFGAVGYNPGFVSGAYDGTIAASNSTGCCAFFSEQVTPYSDWHNATIVFDSNQPYESQIKIFIDGVHNTSISGTPNNSSGNGTSIFIGRRNTDYDTYGDYFYGLLDDFGAWNRALSESEILSLYTGQCPTVTTNCTSLPSNLQEGLVGYWPFCGNANDESGNGHDGTVNGATLTEDRFGNADAAYNFDEGNSISTSYSPSDVVATTYSAWFKTANGGCIIGSNASNSVPNLALAIHTNSTSAGNQGTALWVVDHEGSSVGWMSQQPANPLYNDDQWHHVVGVYNCPTGTTIEPSSLSLFVDGLPINTIEQNVNPSNSPINILSNLVFGMNQRWIDQGFNGQFNGSLDDIGIWNRALSQEEITALYTGEPVSPPAACTPLPANLQEGLVGYWPFCSNANDESGNGNDGTVNGATLTEDRFGNAGSAYGFDGNTSFIQINEDSAFNLLGESSFVCWFNDSTLLNNPGGRVISKLQEALSPPAGWVLSIDNVNHGGESNQYKIRFTIGGVQHYSSLINCQSDWQFLAATYDLETVKIYLNQDLIYSIAQSSNTILFNSPVIIGSYTYAQPNLYNTETFPGPLDDIAIYNRALTPQEVQQLYTLDACTFTVYDTLTTYETLYDTLYTYETVYDTLTTYETVLDTLTTYETLYDTLTTYETVFDTLVTYETLYDTLTTYDTLYDTITTVEMLYDTVITYETLYDTLTTYETIVDTLYEYETITAYDTVTTFVTVTDTLLIDITFTGIEGQPSWLNTVTVFPNPASDHITIDYGNFALLAGYNTIITDAAGATVYSSAVNSQQAYIDINAWGAAGVYYLTIYDAGGAPVAVRHIVLE